MFGHSFGGSKAIQVCRIDPRIKASVDLDGALFGADNIKAVNKPSMIIIGDAFKEFKIYSDEKIAKDIGFPLGVVKNLRRKYYEDIPKFFKNSYESTYLIKISKAMHAAFSDWVLLKELNLYKNNKKIFNLEERTGEIDGIIMTKIVTYFLLTFFDKFLKNKNIEIYKPKWMNGLVAFKKQD